MSSLPPPLDWFADLDCDDSEPRSALTPPGGPIYFRLRRLSHCRDFVHVANEMNGHPNLPEQMKYDYLLHSGALEKHHTTGWGRRPRENEADLALVMDYYNYGRTKARQALKSLRPDQVEALRDSMSQGGC